MSYGKNEELVPVVTQWVHLERFLKANLIGFDTKILYISGPIEFFGNASNYS